MAAIEQAEGLFVPFCRAAQQIVVLIVRFDNFSPRRPAATRYSRQKKKKFPDGMSCIDLGL
jgi:hypothetical protein